MVSVYAVVNSVEAAQGIRKTGPAGEGSGGHEEVREESAGASPAPLSHGSFWAGFACSERIVKKGVPTEIFSIYVRNEFSISADSTSQISASPSAAISGSDAYSSVSNSSSALFSSSS